METSRFKDADLVKSFNEKKNFELSAEIMKMVEKQKKIGRDIWRGKNIINQVFKRKYFSSHTVLTSVHYSLVLILFFKEHYRKAQIL